MKGTQIALFGGLALLLIIVSAFSGSASSIDLSSLAAQYGSDRVQRLQGLANVLSYQGLTVEQIKYMLAQALQETGLFVDAWNVNATDVLNNYAGLSYGGSLNEYATINDFVADWLSSTYLNKGPGYPLQATSINDFNNRLVQNHYYTDSPVVYGNALSYYYNLLS